MVTAMRPRLTCGSECRTRLSGRIAVQAPPPGITTRALLTVLPGALFLCVSSVTTGPEVTMLLVSFAQPLAKPADDSQAGIRVLFAAHGGIGLRPDPFPPGRDTHFAVVVVEIDSPRELKDVVANDVELVGPGGWRAAPTRIVEVEEFVRMRGDEGECAYWINPGGTRPWNGTLPAGSIRLRVHMSLAEEPPPVPQLSVRLRLGTFVAEGPVQCRWPT